ncbi:MAG: hypothetical protein K2I40_00050, partial [Bifidobacterium castoris]|nr:hypothetical protein [Bifidobacterium castoris]
MSRRRQAKPKLTPVWMPYLRGKLADWLDARRDMEYGRPRSDYTDMLQKAWSRGDSMRTSPMWWISCDMTTLAVHTALHEEPPTVTPPSSTGFVIFDGGLDLQQAPDAPLAHICAIRWVIQYDERHEQHVGCAMFTDDPGVRTLLGCDLPLAPMPRTSMGTISDDTAADVFGRILQAMWALSADPTVCETSAPRRPSSLEPLPPRMVDDAVAHVRMVILRENLHSPRTGDKDDARPRREYSHRVIVRCCCRNQPYGKNRELRRRQWIPPYVKGPADKPLI